ncbi:helix-turn-helix domain-containing protein [Microbispora sitophila]|uniref:helix-turn-helix domain-containing protein n=1 Tax=Microbispora sitophila TaxID=2771537 RepID=UPI001D02205F|nr:helix-turn-helix domain-containing protein [Microbispora sitophila]
MLTGRRYLLAFTSEQETFAELVGDVCRAVWNTALERPRQRGAFIGYVEQAPHLRAEFARLRSRLPMLWSRSSSRYIETQDERVPKVGGRA